MTELIISENEKAFLFKNGQFSKLLNVGKHKIGSIFDTANYSWEILPLDSVLIGDNKNIRAAIENNLSYFDDKIQKIQTLDEEIALIFIDKVLFQIVGRGKTEYYWNLNDKKIVVEKINIIEKSEIPANLIQKLNRFEVSNVYQYPISDYVHEVKIPKDNVGLEYIDNQYVRTLEYGTYYFWKGSQKPSSIVYLFPNLVQTREILGQEVLTKDKLGIRFNMVYFYKIQDFKKLNSSISDSEYQSYLYKQIQLVSRQIIENKTLEELLGDKEDLNNLLTDKIKNIFESIGISLETIGVKDVILPGEIRDLFNQINTAEKQAQANLIKRREETAATRSLLNTAKLMEENSVLLRLKELETLENLLQKVGNISVNDGLDGLLELIKIKK